ncbi:hypothetical protein NDU88_007753 [Pleurodeles waltl]|uniref:Uncharacterized protein n=1 Tax=Pleurodeles waltl TaxID=8319 RepID=A0AAV7NYV2_PLEWA|nr:hypothetical protein NDU88_007753 [Pleurodeles waltl]
MASHLRGCRGAGGKIRARSGIPFSHPAECSDRSLGVVRRLPHVPDKLSPHSNPILQQNPHFRRARDGSSGIRKSPS